MEMCFLAKEIEMLIYFCIINVRIVFRLSSHGLEQLCPICDKLRALKNVLMYSFDGFL